MGQYFSSEPFYKEEEETENYDEDFQTILDNHSMGVECDEDFYLDFISHMLTKYKRLKQDIKSSYLNEPLIDERIF